MGFGIIPFFTLFIGYLNIHPEIFRSIPSSFGASVSAPDFGIAWGEAEKEKPPLEYVSDQFTGLKVSTDTVEVNSFWSLWNRPNSEIEYEWTYKVKNLSDDVRVITVTYKLQDIDGNDLDSSVGKVTAKPGQEVEISGRSKIQHVESFDVAKSSWSIGNYISQ